MRSNERSVVIGRANAGCCLGPTLDSVAPRQTTVDRSGAEGLDQDLVIWMRAGPPGSEVALCSIPSRSWPFGFAEGWAARENNAPRPDQVFASAFARSRIL